MRQRPQHMMMQFAKQGHTVLFFNKTSIEGEIIQELAPNLFVIQHPTFFQNEIFPLLSSNRHTIYWTSWSRKIPHASMFHTDTLIYDCVDDFPDWEEEERKYAPLADAVVCTAEHLREKMKQIVPYHPIYLVQNGCEYEHFAQVKELPKIKHLPELPAHAGPRIGYIGAWAPWVNEKIIQSLSKEIPHAQIVIIGPNLRADQPAMGENVFFLGHKNYDSLPFYLRYFDVCIIPFVLNRVTNSTNPVKVYEYLATGKPVVSTPLPELKKMLPHVLIADEPAKFVQAVRKALNETGENSVDRMGFAQQQSWEKRFELVNQQILVPLGKDLPSYEDRQMQKFLRSIQVKSIRIPIRHNTVNSFYRDLHLAKDPVFIGSPSKGSVYECYLQIEESKLIPQDCVQIYFEFDLLIEPQANEKWNLILSHPLEEWQYDKITFRNRPSVKELAFIRIAQPFATTVSFDVTRLVKEEGMHRFHLRSSLNRVLRLDQVRLTCFLKN